MRFTRWRLCRNQYCVHVETEANQIGIGIRNAGRNGLKGLSETVDLQTHELLSPAARTCEHVTHPEFKEKNEDAYYPDIEGTGIHTSFD